MQISTCRVGFIALALSLAVQANAQAPTTVVITAPRPEPLAAYRAIEARIKSLLAQRPRATSGGCLAPAFMTPHTMQGALGNWRLEARIRCGREHVWRKDTTLQQALDAFDKQDYPAARAMFEAAYAKMGTQDAALMLAQMHFDGLGTQQDPAAGIKWLREVADGYFDPWHDLMRFDPAKPQATNARIEAAMLLARRYERGEGVVQDAGQARTWYAKAAEFGYVPALEAAGRDVVAAPGQVAAVRAHVPDPSGAAGSTAAATAAAADAGKPAAPALQDAASAIAATAPAQPAPANLAPVNSPGDGTVPAPVSHDPSLQVDPALAVIRITGLRALPWKSYRAMRAAIAAYEAYKFLAPDTVFRFALMPPAGKTLPPNFALRVRTRDGVEFPIALEHGELFQLPVLHDPGVDADLVSNFREGQLRVGLLVHTRSVAPEKERLGDVRLRNQISQAIAEVDHPNDDPRCRRKRPGRNGCPAPARVTVWHRPRAPAFGATIVEGTRRIALESNGDPQSPAYKMPIWGGQWGNDALIEFDYQAPLPRPRLFSAAIYTAND